MFQFLNFRYQKINARYKELIHLFDFTVSKYGNSYKISNIQTLNLHCKLLLFRIPYTELMLNHKKRLSKANGYKQISRKKPGAHS
ncbi:hypothetical protein LEP1GSC109_0872 [Leptospira interrogans str. UI 13372]|uniref:Uncharacterized protein n=1 Tax=Leptospira interrogans serovar Lora str. TE 1992 TaxID=1193028 RepID=M3ES81_LEPIR|nr:hypothetical protein LEP1GSC087_1781 [Leptospira interrogans serovar Bataviae str. L1111]EMF40661.1 hypothetical protein LEP1GSC067_3100 [Leptospira interrogans serovar Lora str. TE 1992]EMN07226.1 hypothetical protein LEP1GSC053_3704 [Leptospira interrogans serovar Muenchen str. Brem 129]EMN93159.1 hypothetical protein LEP1GSC110_4575 [Leptospira interrogans serovar Medanensis str. UT053]EMO95162.1 hypothetical protein LEP1GSC109_0872 [Leptospira interrogans str. UI 13372]KLO76924.1 Unchar